MALKPKRATPNGTGATAAVCRHSDAEWRHWQASLTLAWVTPTRDLGTVKFYSCLRATIGSTRIARRAGT